MKKKIVLAIFMSVMLVCLFAMGISAENRTSINYTDASGITHTVPVVKYDDDTVENVASVLSNNATVQGRFYDDSSYVVLKAKDGSLCAYPTWYIIEPSGTSASYVAISEVEYGYINSKITDANKQYDRGAVLYIEFPNGMTHLRNNGVFGRGTHYENNVTEICIPSTVIEIQSTAFSNNKTLKKVNIADNSQISLISDDAFLSCSALEYFDFHKLPNLTFIDGFNNCANLNFALDLANSTKLTEIGQNCFNGAGFTSAKLPNSIKYFRHGAFQNNKLTSINLPTSLEYIGDGALAGNADMVLNSGILPKNLTYVGVNFLSGCKQLPETIVFPVGVTTIPDEGFPNVTRPNGKGNLNIVFLGKMTKVIIDGSRYSDWAEHVTVYFAQNTISDFTGKVYSYADKAAGTLGTYVSQNGGLVIDVSDKSLQSTTKVDGLIELIFCGNVGTVEQSYVLTVNGDSITEDRGLYDVQEHTHITTNEAYTDCTAERICIICDVNIANNAHNIGSIITYENGFMSDGLRVDGCQNPNCLFGETTVVNAIFVSQGYSVDLNGIGIVHGYRIDKDAYNMYISAGYTLDYGIVVAVNNSQPLEIVDGVAVKKQDANAVVAPNGAIVNYSFIEIKLIGIPTGYYETPIAICLFVFDGEKIGYLGQDTQLDSAEVVNYASFIQNA